MKIKNHLIAQAAVMVLAMTIICGVLYTAAVTVFSQILWKDKANGSVIEIDGKKYGCELLAQQFTTDEYMWGRIMNVSTFTDQEGNTKMYSGPSNLSPASEEYAKLVEERVANIKKSNPDATTDKIPVDLVTCSGSGLDPEISLAAAEYQIPRIVNSRGISKEEISAIIEDSTKHKILGIFGEETVNVLQVNLMLDKIIE